MKASRRLLLFLPLLTVLVVGPTLGLADKQKVTESKKSQFSINIKVEKYKLPNGLTVIFHVDRSVPSISYHTWFRVGSRDEEPGYTGIAHLFEHMMFKGAKRYTNNDFDKVLRAVGASYNAFTSHDYTGYYIELPSSQLELAMDMESDRLEHLNMNDTHLASEREVVKEERRFRYDNSVRGTLFEAAFSQAFNEHSYRWPIIGWMDDLNAITLAKCKEFFGRFYSVNNAVIVVAGDFDPEKTRKLISKYYSHMKPSEIVRPVIKSEPPMTSPRFKLVEKDVQSETFSLSYHIPPTGTDESYAFDLLSNILSEGNSSRLYKKVVRESQLADSVSAMNYSLKDQGLFMFNVSMKAGTKRTDRDSVLKFIEGEVWRVKNQTISEKEIEKAKTQVMKSYVDGLKTIGSRARLLAMTEIYYEDYNRLFSDLEKYQAVTAQDIRNVAKKYLDKNKSSLVVVAPKPKSKKSAQNNKSEVLGEM